MTIVYELHAPSERAPHPDEVIGVHPLCEAALVQWISIGLAERDFFLAQVVECGGDPSGAGRVLNVGVDVDDDTPSVSIVSILDELEQGLRAVGDQLLAQAR